MQNSLNARPLQPDPKEILELSRQKSDEEDMLPALAYVLNFHHGADLAEMPLSVTSETPLKRVLELM